MSIVFKRPTHRANWLTAALLVILVGAFGIFADAHIAVGSAATAEITAPSGHGQAIASTILDHS